MASPVVYLRSYDKYDEFLAYEPPSGAFQIVSRRSVELLGVRETFGAFRSIRDDRAGHEPCAVVRRLHPGLI